MAARTAMTAVVVVMAALLTSCGSTTGPDAAATADTLTITINIDADSDGTTSNNTADGSTDGTDSSTNTDGTASTSTVVAATYSIVAQATVSEVAVRDTPDAVEPTTVLANPTASGAPLVFRAVDGGATSPDWIEVFLPIQPNGSTGWVQRSDVELSSNPYRVEIDRATYSLRVFNLDKLLLEAQIAVGTGDTPTPVGDFYLMELLAPPDPAGPYGPYAFGLSGFSEVLTSFGGADTAIIGIHGTNDPTSLGLDVSHGCIRVDNVVIEQLATTLPLGTPVGIS